MPITPLPASNTRRLFFHTIIGGTQHNTMVRVDNTTPLATLVTNLQADLTGLKASLGSNVVIDRVDIAEVGSDVRNPVVGWTLITGTAGTAVAGQDLARSFSLRGRTVTGRKVKMLIWGVQVPEQPDFELALVDQPAAMSTFQTQVAARAAMYLAIDGSKPVWDTNYLEDYNGHWERELRP